MNLFSLFFGLKSKFLPTPETIVYETIYEMPFIDCFHADDIFGYLPSGSLQEYPFNDLKQIIKSTELEVITIDFMDINTIGSSKSKESYFTFKSIDEFGEAVYSKEHWTIEECMKHIEERIFDKLNLADVTLHRWNKLLKVSNGDGSHHLAVAQYLNKIGVKYTGNTTFQVKKREKFIDVSALSHLLIDFDFFVVSVASFSDIYQKYNQNGIEDIKDRYLFKETNNRNYLITINKKAKGISKHLAEELKRASSIDETLCVYFNDYILQRV